MTDTPSTALVPRQKREPVAGKVIRLTSQLPASVESEAALIGCLTIAPREVAAIMVSLGITRDYFHVPKHQTVIESIFYLLASGKPVEPLIVCQWLTDRNKLEEVGGSAFVYALFQAQPTASNASHYAEIVIQKYALRQIIIDCTNASQRAIGEQSEVADIISSLTTTATKLAHIGQRQHEPTIAETVMQVINNRQKAQDSPRDVVGIKSLFPSLDAATGGMLRNNLRFWCAPPNTGKTVAMMNNIECVAIINRLPALIFSFEMTRAEIVLRLSASVAGLSIDDIRANRLTTEDEGKWAEAMNSIARAPITIKEGSYNISDIGNISRAWKANNPTGRLITIDGFQGIKFRLRDNISIADQLKRHSTALKEITKELDVTMDVASHMDEKGERTKGSRGPEEDGDMILVLTTHKLTVKKSRSGGKGMEIPVYVNEEKQQVYEIAPQEEEQRPRKGKKKLAE